MERSNKVKFLFISTCVLFNFVGSSGFYMKEENELTDNILEVTDNELNSKISFNDENIALPMNLLDSTETTTTIFSENTTENNALLVKKIIENFQNITIREGKSFVNNETVNQSENNEESLAILEPKILKPTTENANSVTSTPLSISTEISANAVNEKTLNEIVYHSNSTLDEAMNGTNSEKNSIIIDENISNSSKNLSNLVDSKPEEHIEIQKITTGEDLEESIKKSVRDEILIENPIDQNALDVLENIPDPELRESVARDILGDDYIRRSELNANINPDTINVKYETISPNLESTVVSSNSKYVEGKKPDENVSGQQNKDFFPTHTDENKLYYTTSETPEIESKIIDEGKNSVDESLRTVDYTTISGSDIESETDDLNKIAVTEVVNETTESNIAPITTTEGLNEANLPKFELKQNKKDRISLNMQERGGRAMILSNSIINHGLIDDTIAISYMSTPSLTEFITETPTTEISNNNLVEKQHKVKHVDTLENSKKKIEDLSSENEIVNSIDGMTFYVNLPQDTQKPLENQFTNGGSEAEHEMPTNAPQQKQDMQFEQEDLKNIFTTEIPVADNDEGIWFTTESVVEIESDVQLLQSIKNLTSKQMHKNHNKVVAVNAESEMESIEKTPQKGNDATYIDQTTKKETDLKEISDSSDSDSSEEVENFKKDKILVSKSKEKDDKSSSSSDSSEESESGEKFDENEQKKSKTKPKGRSFSFYSTPHVIETETEIFTPVPDISASEDLDSKEIEHTIMKKPSAESEDENSLIPIPVTIKPTVNSKLNLLNPRLKFLLKPDETKKIPELTFETTTLLPLKIFKSNPLQPVVTDDIPNEINFAPRTLDEILPSQQQQQEQHHEDQINQILETESTTKLIGETFTEAVELSKEINRNMNLFLEHFETNRSISTLSSENHSTSSDEIMAASSIAEALPNQDIKSMESSMNATLVILICVSIIVMIIAVLVVTFFRFRTPQGVLDIEMQEQRHGKNYDNDHNVGDNNDNAHIHEKDYNCCTTARSTPTSGIEMEDTLSNSVSLATTSSATTKIKSSSSSPLSTSCSLKSTKVKRSISSNSRSNDDSSAQSVSLLSGELNDNQQKIEIQKQQTIPTEMCKLIPKLQINGDNNFDDDDENL